MILRDPAEPAIGHAAVSAFATAGPSVGVTPQLDGFGEAAVMLLTLMGGTGLLTLGFTLACRAERARVRFPRRTC